MTEDEILTEAHKHCTAYSFLEAEKYHFTEADMLAFAQTIIRPYVQECYSLSASNSELIQELRGKK